MDNLVAARDILRTTIQKSRSIAVSVDQTGRRLNAARDNLTTLQPRIKDVARKFAIYEIRDDVDRAIGPASSVLKALDLVHDLQEAVSTFADIKRLLQAVKLLSESCGLVIMWLEDVVRILKDNAADAHLVRATKVVGVLVELQSFSRQVVSFAVKKLESEYRGRLSRENVSVRELRGVVEVMGVERCVSVHAESRVMTARAVLQSLNLDYLHARLSEIDSIQRIEAYVYEWDKQMEFAVRHVLRKEHMLCRDVFQEHGSHVWKHCFAKIAKECGFLKIFDFGSTVCRCKREAIKLLSLLRVFSTLDKLRIEFNEMFDGEFCADIQKRTRALVKEVVDEACEIFCQLSAQVELQRMSSAPASDGNVPRLVFFVTEYCNRLLEDENKSILKAALEIYQLWNKVKLEDGILSSEIISIIKAVEINLETWAQSYDDTSLSYFFMMNSHWYLCNSTRGTRLGDLMGNSWSWAYEESAEYYQKLYMRESWEKLLVYLGEEGLTLFPGGRAIDRGVVKKRIGGFCDAFDEMFRKQSGWMLHHGALKQKTCRLIIEAIVPAYRSYLQRFVQQESDVGNQYQCYTAEELEDLIESLFQMKIETYGRIDIKNAAAMLHA